MIYYSKGLHEQAAFNNIPYMRDTINTDYLKYRVLSLPIHPYLENEQIQTICNLINTVVWLNDFLYECNFDIEHNKFLLEYYKEIIK